MKRAVSLLLLLIMLMPLAFADGDAIGQADVAKLNEVINTIRQNYQVEVTSDQLLKAAYRGMVESLDRHSTYLDATELEDYNIGLSGSFAGVGMTIIEQGDYVKVVEPFEGSPALAAGLRAGDIIMAVNGIDVKGKPIPAVAALIRGEIGTTVKLTIVRDAEAEPLIFNVVRGRIVVKSVGYQRVSGVDVIKISEFASNTAKQLEDVLIELAVGDKIIIDLRNNPGGYLDQVVEAANLFLAKGDKICSVEYRNYQDQIFESGDDGLTADLVVLVNGDSASASELFAAAMQDNGRAIIVGQTTYGKGTVQAVYNLADGSALKLTIAKYATPSGKFIHGSGVTPDVVVEPKTVVDRKVDNFYPMQSLNTSALGSRDIDTYGLEQRLNYMGYGVVVDGLFDEQTEAVLKRYQREHDMVVDGRLTVAAKIAIQRDVIAKASEVVDAELEVALRLLN